MDQRLKRFMEELGAAINDSFSESERIADIIAEIKADGYDVFLVVNATIGFKRREEEPASQVARRNRDIESRFNPQDIRFLKSLHIRLDE